MLKAGVELWKIFWKERISFLSILQYLERITSKHKVRNSSFKKHVVGITS